jgi:cytochrome b subunit of formate dehydrogenase
LGEKQMPRFHFIKKAVHWLLALSTIVFIITGLGITEYRIVELLTMGLLTKNLAFMIHSVLWIPFVILLTLHVLFSTVFKSVE